MSPSLGRVSAGGDVAPSLFEALEVRESAARGRAERLREQIAALSGELEGVEEELTRLRITRETVDQVLTGTGPVSAGAEPVGDPEAAMAPLVPVMLKARRRGTRW
ncbi:hypothetical protein [Streptomyces sp. NPDC127084]|uniref:hypothetical protein n=1 Tax=Streptomyces sp. NPDC127084 TaxID=3347133 RepID=UPI003650C98A